MSAQPSFRDQNVALRELARELNVVRTHNLSFREGDSQATLLMFAEAALVCMTFEHFVRVVVANCLPGEREGQTFHPLLTTATQNNLIRLPWEDQAEGVRRICAVRNTLLHGNFAQAAREAGCTSVQEYFGSQYAPELEGMMKILDRVMQQIDVETGRPIALTQRT